MPVTKPDATKFDSAEDSIASARPELYTLVTSFNTIADEYNAGTLGGSDELGTPEDLGTATTDPAEFTPTQSYSQLLSNQTATAADVSIKMDNQPLDSVWRVLVVRNPAGETGYSTVQFTLDSGEDSAGGYSTIGTNVTGVGVLFEFRKYSDPSDTGNIFISLDTITVDSKYTP